jgi:hypothetical protein
MSEGADKTSEEWMAFQKIWVDSFAKLAQSAFTITPDSPPPEMLRQIRNGIFQALAQAWDEFLRSPQFLEGMKQWMENAITFRQMTNEFLTKSRHEAQGAAREDIDSVLLAVRHMETRLLDRVEDLAKEVSTMKQRVADRGTANSKARIRPKTTRSKEPRRK